MRKRSLVYLQSLLLASSLVLAGQTQREIRTYSEFSFPVDPAKVHTIFDLNISYALGTQLVEWDDENDLSSGLAESWKITDDFTYQFTLREKARWSDSSPITALDVKRSFERNLRHYPNDLRDLGQILSSIEVISVRDICFKLKVKAQESGLLRKLAIPNFGILKVGPHGNLDLSVTTGAFILHPQSNRNQLILVQNSRWIHADPESPVASQVVLRRAPSHLTPQSALSSDSWANLIESTSLLDRGALQRFEKSKFEIRKSPSTKVCHVHLGKRIANAEGHALMKYLGEKLKPQDLTGSTDVSIATQFYPRGYVLYDPQFRCQKPDQVELPQRFREKPLEILMSPARLTPAVKEKARLAIAAAVGISPDISDIPLSGLYERQAKGDFDLHITTLTIAEFEPEELISFLLESQAPQIPSTGNDLLARFDSIRREKSDGLKIKGMRGILRDAVCGGSILPLFHLGTVDVAKPEIDLSQVPRSAASVRYSKVRFKQGSEASQ